MMYMKQLSIAFILSTVLTGCGGGGSSWDNDDDDDNPAEAPSAPVSLSANAGDRAISLGWSVPTTNGSGSIDYKITLSPAAAAAQFTIVGTTALVRGLNNDTTYTFQVTASNSSGTGPAASIQAKPAATRIADYSELIVADRPSPLHGVAAPAPLRAADGRIWLAYADVDVTGAGSTVGSTIQIAQSNDNGASYRYDQEVGRRLLAPGGFWDYRTPWLIEDSRDPDATRRFKLFAHKYFFSSVGPTLDFGRGAIAMWTASTPDGEWSDETIVLGWTGTDALLQPATRVNQLDTALQPCLWIDQGGASVGSDGIDMVFSCVLNDIDIAQRKIVLLRSANHAQSFSYVATLLQPTDAAAYTAESFDMPALLPGAGTAPVLIASPIDFEGNALGCVVFPIADPKAGKLFMANDEPLALQTLAPAGVDSGDCGWDRSIPANGILMRDRDGSDYTIQATGKSL